MRIPLIAAIGRRRPTGHLVLRAAQLALACVSLLLLTTTGVVSASTYGSGSYGQCAYNADCVTTPPPVQSGSLDVVINVQNNQTIPKSGYEIVIIPTGQDGTPLQQAEVFVDGQSIGVQPVRSDGTIHIFVQPPPDTKTITLDVVVTGQDGTKLTKHYSVRLSAVVTPMTPPASTEDTIATAPAALRPVLHAVRVLPNAVKYAFPYILFVILGLDMALLILYTRREAGEQNKLRALIDRERQIANLKQTFTALTSHYLRTPLAILNGGVDLLTSLNKGGGTAIMNAQAALKNIRTDVEELIKQASPEVHETTAQPTAAPQLPATSSQPMLLIPVILAGVVAFVFDYLAQRAGNFNLQAINTTIQVVIFGTLAILLYIVVRAYQLQRQKSKLARMVLSEEQQFNQRRDTFIERAAQRLSTSLSGLDTALMATGTNPASKFLSQGQKQLHDIVTKLTVASHLKGSEAAAAPQVVSLRALCDNINTNLQDKLTEKKVQITCDGSQAITLAEPALVSYVVQTLADNAIDYSPTGGTVILGTQNSDDLAAITVVDQGPGIDLKKKYALFEAFSKLEGAETFNREGMGFSLYLDRLIMTYLRGGIDLENAAPHGVRAIVTLPRTK